MAHHVTSHDIPVNGEHLDPSKISKVKTVSLAVMVLGSLLSIYFLFLAPKSQQGSYAYSWVFALFYFFTLALGGCFWTLLHNVSNSGWGTSVRRVMENLGSVFPWLSIFAIPLLCPNVQHYLFEWMNTHRKVGGDISLMTLTTEWLAGSWNWVLNGFRYLFTGDTVPMASTMAERLHHADHLLYNKHWFMNLPFWYFRTVMFFAALGFVIYRLRKLSTAQDTDPNPGTVHLFIARRRAAAFLPILALTVTFAAFDWLKGMDYTWFSTMYGVYIFAGCAINSMAVIIITVYLLRRAGYLKHVVSQEHFHIMGKLLFAFTVFWAYVTFSQFFLIWYANITEETKYYLIRNTEGWNIASIALVILHFVLPFVVLLQQWLKKKPYLLSAVAIYMLLVHALDLYLAVIPERGISLGNIDHKTFGDIAVTIPNAWLGDVLAFVTIGAGFVFFYLRALTQHALYPHRDPRILESANLSN
ncbi:MAG: hypothetical protein RLZZ224_1077 [Verrucomicrobiota bacterium]|jgi:hypothetical protein